MVSFLLWVTDNDEDFLLTSKDRSITEEPDATLYFKRGDTYAIVLVDAGTHEFHVVVTEGGTYNPINASTRTGKEITLLETMDTPPCNNFIPCTRKCA